MIRNLKHHQLVNALPLNWLCNYNRSSLLYQLKHSGLLQFIKITKCLSATQYDVKHIDVLISATAECTIDKLWFPNRAHRARFSSSCSNAFMECSGMFIYRFQQEKGAFTHYSFPLQAEWTMCLNMPLLNPDAMNVWIIAVSAMYIIRWLCHYKCFSLL